MLEHSKDIMNSAADNIRVLAASMVEKAKSGHPGGAMGGADFINLLYSEFLVYDPDKPLWPARDRFFLDPGHMSAMLYGVLCLSGKFTLDELKQFRQWGSPTPGHPEVCPERGIENSSGPLGQGHAFAVGAAMAAKFLAAHLEDNAFSRETIWAYISDGGVQEEISLGAARVAGTLGLDNLIMFYDSNSIQLSTSTETVTHEDIALRYRSLGWLVLECNGNDVDDLRRCMLQAKAEDKRPTLIIGHTIMGKGCLRADGTSFENDCGTHGAPLGGEAYRNTIKHLGADPDAPFAIRDKVAQLYNDRREELREICKKLHAEESTWEKAHPDKAQQKAEWFSDKPLKAPWDSLNLAKDTATRAASQQVLKMLAQHIPNMVCASADLSNSDKTDGFLKETHAFSANDWTGAFFQAGVSELTMACSLIGMTLHGGVRAAMGTFFVFSDYMKPAIRMACLMQTPVIFIWTHDSFRVGEDGPTHQPVEQEAQLRLLEHLHNHSGKPSLLALRPADAAETAKCWQMAYENTSTPSALVLSRQAIPSLPDATPYHLSSRGAYVASDAANPQIVAIASGSEVSTLYQAKQILQGEGLRIRIVSAPSEGLFRTQADDYQRSVIPDDTPRFGLTAGLSVTLLGLVGDESHIHGLNSFGFSAPYKELDKRLGFTPENIANEIRALLAKLQANAK